MVIIISVYNTVDKSLRSTITMRTNNKLSHRQHWYDRTQSKFTIKQNNRLSTDIVSIKQLIYKRYLPPRHNLNDT